MTETKMIIVEPYEVMRMLHFIKKIRFHRDTRLRSCQSCFNSPEVDEAIEEIEKHLDKLAAEQQKPTPISQEYLDSKLDELKSCIELSEKDKDL